MSMLAERGNRVLYVDPMVSPAAKLRCSPFFSHVSLRCRLHNITRTLRVLTAPFGVPLSRYPSFCWLNQAILFRCIKYWQERLRFVNPILWVYEPRAALFVDRLPRKVLVYDCVDEHKAYPGVNKNYIERLEQELLRASDVVFVTAEGLLESKKQHNPNVFFLPNGVDTEIFRRALKEETEVARETEALPRPILGFVGSIHSWMDFDLLFRVATANSEASIVLVGPIGRDVSPAQIRKTRTIKNIHLLGYKKAELIPHYVKSFDVCLNLFKSIELTRSVNPIKIYEYLAAGKPTVSVDMPEIRRLAEVIYIAHSPSEFLAKVQTALHEGDNGKRKRRIQKANEYSWSVLLEKAWRCVEIALRNENAELKLGPRVK